MVSTPKAPDPVATANAQANMNQSTAVTQQLLNMTDQVNPWGNVSYQQNGSSTYTDSNGKVITVPKFTQTTTFSPEQQAIFDQAQAAQGNLATIANNQSAKVGETLNNPFEFDNQDAADWAYDLGMSRIRPEQQQNQRALETRLTNAGLRPGTAAWDREMTRLSNANTDQNNQLALTGRSQAFGEALATRNQPLNELTALLSGSQVSNPASMSAPTPQTQVGGVDYAGLVQQNYQNKLQASQAGLGGLFGLVGSLGGAAITKYSDVRLKEHVERVGTLDNGLPVYSYRYKAGGPFEIGLLAQDVERVHPEAVFKTDTGYLAVDYAKAVQ